MGDANPADPTVLPGFGQDQPDHVRFPNTRLRNSRSASISTWTTTSGGHSHTHSQPNNNPREPEQCRICRGEATPDDPLYHPCKCSGSIKWVHQECLMQWLAQTQRKHCELCKTPFRFTKLYDPDMPRTVPAHIFIGHMFKYSVRKLLVWARAALVVSVWLGWLPYFMRSVWAMLFWLCEEGWGGPALFSRSQNISSNGFSVTAYSTTVCPSSPLFLANTSPASVGDVLGRLPLNSTQFVNSLTGANSGAGYSFLSVLLRIIFGSGGIVDRTPPPLKEIPSHLSNNVTATLFIDQTASPYSNVSYPPSLLSEVGFLKNLTRNPTVNNNIIAVLEGQIITVLVVVCFILIILVRDYVVQQQPEINERAAFANLQNVQPQVAQVNVPDPAMNGDHNGGHNGDHNGDHLGGIEEEEDAGTDDEHAWHAQPPQPGPQPDRNPVNNPYASDLERELGESDSSTIDEYLNIYREAGGNPDRIVELAQERGLEERLAYWIALTKTMKERAARVQANYNDGLNPSAAESSTTAAARPSGHNLEMDSTPAAPRPDPFDDWRYPLEEDDHQAEETGQGSRDKGKGVATDDFDTESDPEIIGASSRPRANTDGPEIRMHTNPLGSNSWSFNDLPEDGPNSPSTEERPSQVISTAPDLNTDNYSSNTEVEPLLASLAGQGESESFQENRSQDGNRDIADDVRVHTEPWGANPIPERQSESQELTDIPWPTLDESTADSPAQPPQPRGFVPRVTDFMWQGVEADQAQHDAIDIIADALMRRDDQDNVDVRDDARLDNDDDLDQDDDDAAAAIGLEQDAIDDAEDLEGVLELLGMRGPLAGLFQNAIFCVLLVSATIFLGLFVPYNIGRYSLWFIAKPMRPVWILYSLCRFIQDMVVIAFGLVSHALSLVHPSLGLGGVARLVTKLLFGSRYATATLDPHIEMTNAAKRVGHTVIHELGRVSMSEIHTFSAVSHEALLSVKGQIFSGFAALGSALVFIFGGDYSTKAPLVFSAASSATALALNALKTLPATLLKPNLVINVNFPDASHAIDPALAYWNGTDRFWAILAGYLTIYIAAVLYLRRGGPISSSQTGQEWEAAIIDALNQASGVMKVILIIGIEMLVFPLYCGMLLDIALLPLFENATLMSRLQFTLNFPVTSIFVHWFVGTAYMFHFALFVSMCRKIMRRGVLYFIRDPDDPEFHPVRDVLERNVTTQLRKIAFSALVYGALVIICLGAVVWGLALSLPNVLPIHYSSNEPVLEFPLDLLFYNFLMPLAVKFFKPGDGLHAMYTWWFRTCGRCLRITWFLFGERKADEEGRLRMIERGPGSQESWWQAMFLQLDESNGLVRPWKPKFVAESTKAEASESEPESPNIRGYVPSESEARESEARERSPEEGFKDYLVDTKQLIPDGRFVRAPASDQVKIPKGKTVFLEVSEKNERLDGKPDVPETDLYSTTQYRLVYVPPHFRVRIFFFILLIWMFAAATGVGITIIPLVFGRWMFQLLIPEGVRTNDIYAFGIGIHVLGSIVYALINIRSLSQTAKIRVAGAIVSVFNNGAVRRGLAVITRIAKIVYSYFFLLVVFPLMIASVAELYFMMPLHEFMYSVPIAQDIKQVTIEHAAALNPRHTIRVMQSWTIGLLYLKLSVRGITTWFSGSRLALATKAVLRRGWFNPNAGVLTRAFVIPAILLWTVAMAIPTLFAKFMISWSLAETLTLRHPQAVVDGVVDQTFYDAYVVLIYRRSFPLTALLLLAVAAVWGLLGVFQSWKMRIRDEAYLIGERLQNYGGGMPQRGLGRGTRGGWRAGIAVGGR